jgi:hypothetical protein
MTGSARRVPGAFALVAACTFVGACSGGEPADEAAGSSAVSSSAATGAPDLASGLLAAEAFGADATVVAITPEQLQQGAGVAASGAEDLQITPAECAAAVQGTQPDFDDFGDVAAQSATTGSTTTVEVLVRGGPTKDTVDLLDAAVERCPQAQIASPQFGQATITFESLPVDDLGDGAAVLRYTTTVSLPNGTQATVPALIGAVQDHDRLLVLLNLQSGHVAGGGAAVGTAPEDPAAFTDLLEEAYEVQAEALD